MTATATFQAGRTYQVRSVCDADCIFQYEVLKRTAKTLTIKSRMRGERRVGIKADDQGVEIAWPEGLYSMAPIMQANR